MATLNNANIINGNPVETADILQLYTALGTGSPGDITGLVITGSLDGSATSIVIPTPSTITGTYYPALVPGNAPKTQKFQIFYHTMQQLKY
jgi:hypothetical protein